MGHGGRKLPMHGSSMWYFWNWCSKAPKSQWFALKKYVFQQNVVVRSAVFFWKDRNVKTYYFAGRKVDIFQTHHAKTSADCTRAPVEKIGARIAVQKLSHVEFHKWTRRGHHDLCVD
jgi:hypothetical protein